MAVAIIGYSTVGAEVGGERAIRHHIPTIATLCNLVAGFLAIGLAVEGHQDFAALLVIGAVLLDAVDGALARMFNASSDLGVELDSLADMVSFAVAPAVLVASLLPEQFRVLGWLMAACFPLCAGLRLARFSVRRLAGDSEEGFVGLPTTGAGGCVAATVLTHFVLIEHGVSFAVSFLPWVMLLLAGLMVSTLPYPHVGMVLARFPAASIASAVVILVAGVLYWEYELLFVFFFWGYVASGPALVVRERIKAFREAHSHPG